MRTIRLDDRPSIPWRALSIGLALLMVGPALAPAGASAAPERPEPARGAPIVLRPAGDAPDAANPAARPDGLLGIATSVTGSGGGSFQVNGVFTWSGVTVSPAGPPAPTGTVTISDGTGASCVVTLPGTTCSYTNLTAGVKNATATYSGDGTYDPSSAFATYTVGKANTSVTLTSSANPSTHGSSVTFTATVNESPSGPTNPTGTVSFFDGTTLLGTGTVSANVATFTTTALSLGTHSITATYGGDANFNTSTSAVLSQSVVKLTSSTTVVSSQNPSVYGQSVTFTATVTGSGGTPTGTVTFDDGTTVLAARVLSAGQATLTTSLLAAGTHPIKAVYHGNEDYLGSASATLNQVVNKASTSVTLTRTPASSTVYGQGVTFTANLAAVSPGAGTPTGFVLFMDGGITIGVGFVDGTGEAEFATFGLSVGSHTITAVYGGDANFLGVTSSGLAHTVNKADTTVTLTRSTNVPFPANPSKFQQTVIFTAAVTVNAPGGGIPAGTVTFKDGSTTLATVDLNLDGVATFQTNTLSVGSHTITADYSGSPYFNVNTVTPSLAQTVNKADTTLVMTQPPNASTFKFGQPFTLAAQLTVTAPGAGSPTPPTGDVQFKFVNNATSATYMFGSNPYVAAQVAGGAAQTSIPLQYFPPAATYSVTAMYVGDGNFNASPSSAVITVTIQPAATTIGVTSSLSPSLYGQAITFNATVSVVSPGSAVPGTSNPDDVPTGQVKIYLTGAATVTLMGTLTVVPGQPFSGSIQIPAGSLAVGTYNVQAEYLPLTNPNFTGSLSAVITQVVQPGSTTTKLTSSVNPSLSGQNTTLTATIAVTPPAGGTPTGNVTFKNGGVPIAGCTAVPLVGLLATCTTSFGTGTYTLTAVYNGDGNFNSSTSGGVTQIVTTAPTTVTLVDQSVPNPTTYGQTASFKATVTAPPGSGTPTGTVNFRRAGVTIVGCGSVALVAGIAVCNTTTLPAGDNPISAVFTPTSDHGPGTSNTIFHTVLRATTTTALTRLPNASTVYGQPVTFSATVTSASGTPTGTVVFKSDGVKFAEQSLVGGAASFTIASLPVGAHTITAVYAGDANFNTSTGTLAHTVNLASTTTTVTSSVNPSVFGQAVTFTATVVAVAPGTGTPTGTVTFKDGAASIGTGTLNASGQASFTTSALAVGSRAITAVYAGDGNYGTSTGALPTQVVNQAATTTTVTAAPSPSVLGSPVTFTAVVTANPPGSGTPTGAVTFKDGASNIAGCVGVLLSISGQATCTTSALGLGLHTISAIYGGSASFLGSTGTVSHLVSDTPVDLAVVKTSTPNPVLAGTDLTYTITVTNKTALATSATLTDPLPAQVTFVSVTPPAGWTCTDPGVGNPGTVTCTTPVLAASGTAVFGLVVHVPLDTPAGTILTNTASVSGGLPDPDLTNNASTNETTVYRFRRP